MVMTRLFLALAFAVFTPLFCAAQSVGDTAASVEALLGAPPMVRSTSQGELWVYTNGARITVKGGVVVAVDGVSKDAVVYQPSQTLTVVPEPERARPAAPAPVAREGASGAPAWTVISVSLLAVIVFASNIVILVRAFKAHVLWGLGSLFVPLVSLIFVICHWSEVKKPFLVGLGGGVAIVVLAFFGEMSAAFQA